MANCSFCDGPVEKGTGLLYVKKDGTLYYLCSSKCRKNTLNLGREGRRQKWTPAAKKFIERQARKESAAKAAAKAEAPKAKGTQKPGK